MENLESALELLIEEEVSRRVKELSDDVAHYKDIAKAIPALESKIKCLTSESENRDVEVTLLSHITKENVADIIGVFVPATWKESQHFSDDGRVPAWFPLVVNHYRNREFVFQLLDIANVKYPSWAKNLILPYEWDSDVLDIFFANMKNHYVCNGAIFGRNIDFWYRQWSQFQFDPIVALSHQYSEVPWQFVLRNPLLVEKKYIDKMIIAISSQPHGEYFLEIFKYQEDLGNVRYQFVNKLEPGGNTSQYHNVWVGEFLQKNISSAEDDKAISIMANAFKSGKVSSIPKISPELITEAINSIDKPKNLFSVVASLRNYTDAEKLKIIKHISE